MPPRAQRRWVMELELDPQGLRPPRHPVSPPNEHVNLLRAPWPANAGHPSPHLSPNPPSTSEGLMALPPATGGPGPLPPGLWTPARGSLPEASGCHAHEVTALARPEGSLPVQRYGRPRDLSGFSSHNLRGRPAASAQGTSAGFPVSTLSRSSAGGARQAAPCGRWFSASGCRGQMSPKQSAHRPGRFGSVDRVWACRPKGPGFDSSQGHVPGL